MACRKLQNVVQNNNQNNSSSNNSSSSREMRNKAEKQRRDRLNKYINELSMEVPLISMATKKMDKTSILRLSAAYLRINNVIKNNFGTPKEDLSNLDDQLASLVLEAMNGFLLVLNAAGKIVFVSDDVDKLLGYPSVDILGHSVYHYVHPDDRQIVKKHVDNPGRCSFHCRMTERKLPRSSEPNKFDTVHIVGYRRQKKKTQRSPEAGQPLININGNHIVNGDVLDVGGGTIVGGEYNGCFSDICACNNHQAAMVAMMDPAFCYLHRDTYSSAQHDSSLFIGVVRLVRNQPITELSLMDAFRDEYITHHLLDGRIIAADHRISVIAGYLPSEVIGFSAYQYICVDDHSLAFIAHRQMFVSHGGGTPLDEFDIRTTYKLRTKANTFVYLQSKGMPRYDSVTKKLDSFLCVNYLLPEEEGVREMSKLRYHFSPTVYPGTGSSPPVEQRPLNGHSQTNGYPEYQNGFGAASGHHVNQSQMSPCSTNSTSSDECIVAPTAASVFQANHSPANGMPCQCTGKGNVSCSQFNGTSLPDELQFMDVQKPPPEQQDITIEHPFNSTPTTAAQNQPVYEHKKAPPLSLLLSQSAIEHQAAVSDLSPTCSHPRTYSFSQSSESGSTASDDGYGTTDGAATSGENSYYHSPLDGAEKLTFFPTPYTWSSLMGNGLSAFQEFTTFE